MAKAKVTLPGGISVDVNGTPEEVVAVVENLRTKHADIASRSAASTAPKGRGQIPTLIHSLKSEEFFRTPRGLSAVQSKLAELGHHYPVTTLSGAMQAEAKSRRLRRFKQDGKYVYVQ
jgi:superfamily II DNA/RNA helicase